MIADEVVLDANLIVGLADDHDGRAGDARALLQRDRRLGAIATFAEALTTTPGFLRATI